MSASASLGGINDNDWAHVSGELHSAVTVIEFAVPGNCLLLLRMQ